VSDVLLATYDEVPFDSGPIPVSHPESLATVATLYGMSPAPVERCRVLELGCSTGGNLIGMAFSLPDSSFVGIDLSPRQIAAARALADAVGVTNVDLRAMSIADVGDDFGTFDYIVCHGVYSWVPREIQDGILRICARHLSPHGVAYVSYNTYPGWHARAMVRDMIVFHDDPTLPPRERVERGRGFVEFLTKHASGEQSVYRAMFERELATLRTMSDSHFLHEELEAVNEPVWYWEFVRRASVAGLQVLDEAGLSAWNLALPPEASEQLQHWSATPVQLEQYLDFLRDRTFRRSLLCRSDVARTARPSAKAMPSLYVTGRVVPMAPAADAGTETEESFQSAWGHVVSTSHPAVRAALHLLHETMPRAYSFAELWSEVCTRLQADRDPDGRGDGARELADAIVACAVTQLVQLHVRPATCASSVSDRPMASKLARLDAATGRRVTSLRHYSIELSPLDRAVVVHLDGTLDRGQLVEAVGRVIRRDEIPFGEHGRPGNGELAAALDASLHRLARWAVLVN
jgi:SAM-dependent methyltransferase/methyltransferase-like protein